MLPFLLAQECQQYASLSLQVLQMKGHDYHLHLPALQHPYCVLLQYQHIFDQLQDYQAMHPTKIHVKDKNKFNLYLPITSKTLLFYLDFIIIDVFNKISICIKITFFSLLVQVKGFDVNPIINKVLVSLTKKTPIIFCPFP